MKQLALWTVLLLLVGCSATKVPVVCSPEVVQSLVKQTWEYVEVPSMERGKQYKLPGGNRELEVLEQTDADYSKCLAYRSVDGQSVPLVEGERSFGFVCCRHTPQYVLVFNNFASRQNQVLLYEICSAQPILCSSSESWKAEPRVSWRVASWSKQGILLVGNAEDASQLYHLLPLE